MRFIIIFCIYFKNKKLHYFFVVVLFLTITFAFSIYFFFLLSKTNFNNNFLNNFHGNDVACAFFLLFICLLIEDYTNFIYKNRINKFKSFHPPYVKLLDAGNFNQWKLTKASDLKKNDLILVEKGEIIGADGIVYQNKGYVSTKFWNRSSIPIFLNEEDKVYSGYVNLENDLIIKVSCDAEYFSINSLIRTFLSIQKGNNYCNRLSRIYNIFYYFLQVLLVIVAFLLSYSFLHGEDVVFKIYIAFLYVVSFLICFCPPLFNSIFNAFIFVTMSKCYKNEILINNINIFDKTFEINGIFLDIDECLPNNEVFVEKIKVLEDSSEYLSILKSLLLKSSHPISQAVLKHLQEIGNVKLTKVIKQSGLNISADYKNRKVSLTIFSKALENNHNLITNDIYAQIVLILDNEIVAGFNTLSTYRINALNALHSLKMSGYDVFLSTTATQLKDHSLLTTVDADKIYYRIKQNKQAKVIKLLKSENYQLLTIGDGIKSEKAFEESTLSVGLLKNNNLKNLNCDAVFMSMNLNNVLYLLALSKLLKKFFWFTSLLLIIYYLISVTFVAFVFIFNLTFSAFVFFGANVLLIGYLYLYSKWEIKLEDNYF